MSDFGRVCVLMGGQSAEREISLQSGQACLQGLLNAGVDAYGLDMQDHAQTISQLIQDHPDCVMVMLHGPVGEDGTIQGALEMLGIPYTGSGVLGSALGMDKVRCKQIWQQLGLPTPKFVVTTDADACKHLRLPLCVKPVFEGSSMGVSRVESWDALPAALELASQYGQVMVEEWIEGEELTLGIVGERLLPVIAIRTATPFYDYEAKYLRDDTQYVFDSVTPDAQRACQALAWQAFEAVAAQQWGRVDMIQDAQGNNWLIEVNTVPGMTTHSLVPKAAAAVGLNFEVLLLEILAQVKMPAMA